MSTILRARWILPIDGPAIEGGWIEVAHGRVVTVGRGRPPAGAQDLGDVAVLPGLVNAHTHLELSWMAGLVPPAPSMDRWIHRLLDVRRRGPRGGREEEVRAAYEAAATLRASGVVLVGDVSNSLITPPLIRGAGLGGAVFYELMGFDAVDPAGAVHEATARARAVEDELASEAGAAPIVVSVVAHAPYSVSPELFRTIARASGDGPLTVHLGESQEEIEFLRTGGGPIRRALETLGVWTDSWHVPGVDPVRYIETVGYLQPGLIAVHGVHLADDALERLREAGARLVTCPRSNIWVGAGPPRLSHFYASGVPVAIGTDSLASSPSLNLFDELAEMRRLAPDVAAASMLESATRIGAEALGWGDEFGTIAPGKRARLTIVDVPAGERDVEEYLVSGVPAGSVRATD